MVLNAMFGTQGLHQRGHLPVIVSRHCREKAVEENMVISMASIAPQNSYASSVPKRRRHTQLPSVPIAIITISTIHEAGNSLSLLCHATHIQRSVDAPQCSTKFMTIIWISHFLPILRTQNLTPFSFVLVLADKERWILKAL